jgi:hypothetical protein
MKAVKVFVPAMRICGGLLLVLGLAIWTGNGDELIPVHVTIGVILIGSLWAMAAIAARGGVSSRTVALTIAWGVVVLLLGLVQEELLRGSWHWVIQVLHLVISMGAVWWGGRLAQQIRRTRAMQGPSQQAVASVPHR